MMGVAINDKIVHERVNISVLIERLQALHDAQPSWRVDLCSKNDAVYVDICGDVDFRAGEYILHKGNRYNRNNAPKETLAQAKVRELEATIAEANAKLQELKRQM